MFFRHPSSSHFSPVAIMKRDKAAKHTASTRAAEAAIMPGDQAARQGSRCLVSPSSALLLPACLPALSPCCPLLSEPSPMHDPSFPPPFSLHDRCLGCRCRVSLHGRCLCCPCSLDSLVSQPCPRHDRGRGSFQGFWVPSS